MSKDNNTGQIIKKSLSDTGIMFVLMLAMFISAFVAIGKMNIDQAEELQHCIFGLVGMVFIFMLYGIRFLGRKTKNYDEYFNGMILVLFVMFYMVVSIEISDGVRGVSGTIMFLSTWDYLMNAAFCLLLWLYQRKYFENTEKEKRLHYVMIILCALYAANSILNVFIHHIYYIDDYGYEIYSHHGYVLSILNMGLYFMLNLIHVIRSRLEMRMKVSLASFFAIPLIVVAISTIAENAISDHLFNLLLDYSLLLSLYLVFFNMHIEEQNDYYRQIAENTEMRTSIVASQIGPHFLYNALATISAICEEEGAPKASDAVAKFATYLRMNLDSIGSSKLVKFEEELEHVKTYIWLEQMRFGDDLKVEYNIGFKDFMLPPLVVQPIVENAVVHGVLKKEEGGTVNISTMRQDDNVIITIEDDGIGYDVTAEPVKDGRSHIGVGNVSSRLENIVGGKLEVTSEIGKGTTARIVIPVK